MSAGSRSGGWRATRSTPRGAAADPGVARRPGVRAASDALYDSSAVPHASRWSLPLPDAHGHARRPGGTAVAHAGPAGRRAARRRRCAVLLPPGAVPRRHAPRGRALHGAGPGRADRRSALAARRAAGAHRATWRWRAGRFGWAMPVPALPSTTSSARTRSRWPPTASAARCCAGPNSCPSSKPAAMPRPAGGPTPAGPGWPPRKRRRRASCAAMAAGVAAVAPWALGPAGPGPARLPPDAARGPGLVRLGRPPAAHRGRVGSRGAAVPARLPLGRRLGVDGQPLRALPGIHAAPLPRLFGALVRRPTGAARRLVRDPAALALARATATTSRPSATTSSPGCAAARCKARAARALRPGAARRASGRATITENQPCASVQCCTWRNPASLQQGLEVGRLPLVGVLGVDALAGGEGPFGAGPAHRAAAAAPRRCISMRDAARLNSATCRHWRTSKSLPMQPVEVAQQVEVEGRGDAQRVVVGGLQHVRRLDAVDADQQRAARCGGVRLAQQPQRGVGREVADARARVEHQRRAAGQVRRAAPAGPRSPCPRPPSRWPGAAAAGAAACPAGSRPRCPPPRSVRARRPRTGRPPWRSCRRPGRSASRRGRRRRARPRRWRRGAAARIAASVRVG